MNRARKVWGLHFALLADTASGDLVRESHGNQESRDGRGLGRGRSGRGFGRGRGGRGGERYRGGRGGERSRGVKRKKVVVEGAVMKEMVTMEGTRTPMDIVYMETIVMMLIAKGVHQAAKFEVINQWSSLIKNKNLDLSLSSLLFGNSRKTSAFIFLNYRKKLLEKF
ncbi:40S ribosomal protein S2-like [Nasonia vitripennis]|uniref:Uncharacterized protein n=1 Tax=Nasonia vitripennis TaxID=7425 RepID=A0A7M7QLR2_NASVI|nr:40S ribosomal protein S2-like [Nasonia vitripennis]